MFNKCKNKDKTRRQTYILDCHVESSFPSPCKQHPNLFDSLIASLRYIHTLSSLLQSRLLLVNYRRLLVDTLQERYGRRDNNKIKPFSSLSKQHKKNLFKHNYFKKKEDRKLCENKKSVWDHLQFQNFQKQFDLYYIVCVI